MQSRQKIYTVSELNAHIRSILEGRFAFIQVSGEISSLRKPYSGHLYFTIKDRDAQLKAVCFKMQQRYLSEPLVDGKQVVCKGRISVYEPRGEYQLLVDTVDFAGQGNLQAEFEKLKKKLAAQGLFDASVKRPLPVFPQRIVLVTSPQGAAVHDFIKVAHSRWPAVQIAIYPVSVQGATAAGEMKKALLHLNKSADADVIVLCRGGGSIEDLWAFNDEELARTIRASSIPVVSAVGHEIDFTIADFTADMRAPTPSAAAEMIIPDRELYTSRLKAARNAMVRALKNNIMEHEHRLMSTVRRLGDMPHPIDAMLLKIGRLSMQLEQGISSALQQKATRLQQLERKLEGKNPAGALVLYERNLRELHRRLAQGWSTILHGKKQSLASSAGVLDAVSPLATLARGYAVAQRTGADKKIIMDASTVQIGERLDLRLHKGRLHCLVEGRECGEERKVD